MAKQEYFEMIDSKLKAGFIAIIFLFVLVLDAPEFVICSHNVPDEILDIPRVLLNGQQLCTDFYAAIGTKTSPVGYQGSTTPYYAAGIKRKYCRWEGRYQQNQGKEEVNLIKKMNLFPLFREKSNQISSLFLTLSFPVLRI
jgi:hypothetical protein